METASEVKQKKNSDTKYRNVCFTVFNDTEKQFFEQCKNDSKETASEVPGVILYPGKLEEVKYIIIGIEICPKTKKEHYQGYMEFNEQIRFSKLKKLQPKTHFENRKGTALQASDYCKKDGNFFIFGEISHQGKIEKINITKEVLTMKNKEEAKNYLVDNLKEKYILSYNNVKSFVNDNFKEEIDYNFKSKYKIFKETNLFDNFKNNLKIEKDRFKLTIVKGESLLGKTQYIRSIGPHLYFRSYINFEDYKNCEKVDYIVLDDIEIDINFANKIKGVLLSMGENILTDKYAKKFRCNINKPHVFICNDNFVFEYDKY